MPHAPRPVFIALVAGETSGDNLGAHLIEALRERLPDARFAGIAGPGMIAAGCEAWEHAESLAVMGLFEIIPHLPRLLRIRRNLIRRLLEEQPDVYVGVDAKEFNLRLMPRLKAQGIRTVQYVSPQVWAWRQGRVRTIGRAVDLILCLLPFEKQFYDAHHVRAQFVGHPLADRIPLHLDPVEARRALGLLTEGTYVALLPGSRHGEVSRLAPDFAATVAWLCAHRPQWRFVAALASARTKEVFEAALNGAGVRDHVTLVDARAQQVMAASDAVLLASGTATLEATLIKRPMVVAYRLGALTSFLLKHLKLFKAPFFAQPNLLAGRQLVPEYFNEQVRADVLGPAIVQQIERADRGELVQTFTAIHEQLRRDASARAADAIVELVNRGRRTVRREADGGRQAADSEQMSQVAMTAALHCPLSAVRRPLVAGVDEAGRGPLAGPVVAAAVILDPRRRIRGIRDSKVIEPAERAELATKIRKAALACSVAWADVEEIDTLNILEATYLAMRRALMGLRIHPAHVQIDGNRCPSLTGLWFECTSEAIIDGDALRTCIGAASILAKVTRDEMMIGLDRVYPEYGFASHKGYSTPQHYDALDRFGPTPIHRRSFEPVRLAWSRGQRIGDGGQGTGGAGQ